MVISAHVYISNGSSSSSRGLYNETSAQRRCWTINWENKIVYLYIYCINHIELWTQSLNECVWEMSFLQSRSSKRIRIGHFVSECPTKTKVCKWRECRKLSSKLKYILYIIYKYKWREKCNTRTWNNETNFCRSVCMRVKTHGGLWSDYIRKKLKVIKILIKWAW